MRDLTVSFFLPLAAAADEDVAAEDESMFELPVMLPNDVVVVVAGGVTDEVVLAVEEVVTADAVMIKLLLDELFTLLPPPFVFVVVEALKSTASLDGDGSICSSSICSTRQYSL